MHIINVAPSHFTDERSSREASAVLHLNKAVIESRFSGVVSRLVATAMETRRELFCRHKKSLIRS